MPVYNTLRYLDKAVNSILQQTFSDFEFLIFDDGSTDGSRQRLQKFANEDARIRLYLKEHSGLTPLLNEGIQLSRGQFIARMDSDDIAAPERFKIQLNFLNNHKNHVAVGSEILRIDPVGLPIGIQGKHTDHQDIIDAFLNGRGGSIIHPSAMFVRSALEKISGYRPDLEPAEDLDLFIRLSEVGKLANVPEVLLKYRLHFKRTTDLRRQEQLQKVQAIVAQARHQRGMSALPEDWIKSQKTLTPKETRSHWARTAIREGYCLTGLKHAFTLAASEPYSKERLKLAKSALTTALRSTLSAKSMISMLK